MVTPFATDFSIAINFLVTEVNLFSNNAFLIAERINFFHFKIAKQQDL